LKGIKREIFLSKTHHPLRDSISRTTLNQLNALTVAGAAPPVEVGMEGYAVRKNCITFALNETHTLETDMVAGFVGYAFLPLF